MRQEFTMKKKGPELYDPEEELELYDPEEELELYDPEEDLIFPSPFSVVTERTCLCVTPSPSSIVAWTTVQI